MGLGGGTCDKCITVLACINVWETIALNKNGKGSNWLPGAGQTTGRG